MDAQVAAAAEGKPLRRLPSPPRLPCFCLRCFSACNCFSRRVGADGAALFPLQTLSPFLHASALMGQHLPSSLRLPYFCLQCFSACSGFSRRIGADGAASLPLQTLRAFLDASVLTGSTVSCADTSTILRRVPVPDKSFIDNSISLAHISFVYSTYLLFVTHSTTVHHIKGQHSTHHTQRTHTPTHTYTNTFPRCEVVPLRL